MEIKNHLGWNGFTFRQYNSLGELNVTYTTFRMFDIVQGRELKESIDDQRDTQLKDEVVGEPPQTHLFRQTDFIPFKPGTDLTAIAQAWTTDGKPQKSWSVGLEITRKKETIEKFLRVHGPREWVRKIGGNWELSEPEAVTSVPLDYFHAYGGEKLDEPIVEGARRNCNIYNPVGPGIIENKKYKPEVPIAAPQIEDQDTPILVPYGDYVPQGFAPISPVWRFREQYTGTYDQEWLDTHHPFLPESFDYHFYNCAHPDLVIKPYLNSSDRIRAVNLHPYYKNISFGMPDILIGANCVYDTGETKVTVMSIDGVHLELLQATPKVRMTWRCSFPWKSRIKKIEIGKISIPRLEQLLKDRLTANE